MRPRSLLLLFAAFVAFATAGYGQATPAPQVKVGLINSQMFTDQTNGVRRLLNAIRTLDIEFRPRRDEIAQLVARFNTLNDDAAKAPTAQKREQLQTLQTEITRKQEDARLAFARREATLTNPVRLNIFNALEAYARQRGVDVLIDVSKFPDGVLLVNKNADLTAAFIRDFNTKNP